MIIKEIVYKVRIDLKEIFKRHRFHLNDSGEVNYDEYWKTRRGNLSEAALSSWQKTRADLVLPYFTSGDTVLDVGCGDGNMLEYFKEHCSIKPIGVDMSSQSLEAVKAKGIEAYDIDLTKVERLGVLPEVDYLTGFEIIEHMPDPEKFIYALTHKVQKGFIFSFPNTGYYTHRLRLFFGKFPLQWRAHPGEHLRYWTVDDAKYWVKDIGFELDALLPYEGVPLLNKLFPKLFAQGIIIVMHKNHK